MSTSTQLLIHATSSTCAVHAEVNKAVTTAFLPHCSFSIIQMLPQVIALGSMLRNKLAEEGVVPPQKPLCSELDVYERVQLINSFRAQHGGAPITEDDYRGNRREWVSYLHRYGLVRPSWMKNVN